MKKSTRKNSISPLRLRKKYVRYKLTKLAKAVKDLQEFMSDTRKVFGDDRNYILHDITAHTQEAYDYLKLAQRKGREWWRKA